MTFKLLALVLLTLVCAYQLLLHGVETRSAANPIPDNVRDVYDAETYQKWRAYQGEKSRLQWISTLVSFAVSFLLLLTDAYAAAAARMPDHIYLQLTAVLLVELVAETAVGAVIGYVDTMVIEEKYGFNRSTLKTFVMDKLKGFAISAVVSIGLMSAFAAIHQALGDWVVVLFAALVFALVLLIVFLYPVLSRIGNKFTPLEDGELKEQLTALLSRNGYKVKAIQVMDASRRTTKINAYFSGFGRMKTIVLFDTLLQKMTTEEICAVFAHELGHGLHKDVLKQQLMNIVTVCLMALLAWLTVRYPAVYRDFGFEQVNYGFAFILLSSIELSVLQPLVGLWQNAYSRKAEYRADQQAVKEGYGPVLASALKKLARDNFSHLSPSPLLVALDYSHPPLSQRLDAIEKKQ